MPPKHLGPNSPIPDKLYFRIGEVSALVGVQTHVLRYWEKEIPCIRPGKTQTNQRRYRRRDVEHFREIRRLLYQERYTLAGARKRIMSRKPAADVEPAANVDVSSQATFDWAAQPNAEPVHESEQPAAVQEPTALPAGAVVLDHTQVAVLRTGLRDLIALTGEPVAG